MPALATLLAPLLGPILRALAWAGGALGLYLKGRADAAQHARTEAMAVDLHTRDERDAIDRAIARDADPVGRLQRDWSRPDPVRPVAPDPDRGG